MSSRRPQKGLGAAIKMRRERTGLSKRALADRAEISASWLAQVETGAVDPTWATVRRIAKGLEVPLEELAAETERLEHE